MLGDGCAFSNNSGECRDFLRTKHRLQFFLLCLNAALHMSHLRAIEAEKNVTKKKKQKLTNIFDFCSTKIHCLQIFIAHWMSFIVR